LASLERLDIADFLLIQFKLARSFFKPWPFGINFNWRNYLGFIGSPIKEFEASFFGRPFGHELPLSSSSSVFIK
jgi:hypothetical protein